METTYLLIILLLVLLLVLAGIVLFYGWYNQKDKAPDQPVTPPVIPPVRPSKVFPKAGPNGEDVVTTYDPTSLIFSYSPFTDSKEWINYVHKSLRDAGYFLEDECACSGKIELWRYDSDTMGPKVTLIGDDKNAIGKGSTTTTGTISEGSGLSLNFDLVYKPEQIRAKSTDDDRTKPVCGGNQKPVRVGVVDTGVDYCHPELNGFLWPSKPLSPAEVCIGTPALFGANLITPGAAPKDQHGHGTQLCGIIAGFADHDSDYKMVNMEVVNVKFTSGRGGNGSLFKAICGVYYAMNQGAKVINMSWGYLDTEAPELMRPLLARAERENIVLVAGIGNNAVALDKDLRFWPASFATESKVLISVGGLENQDETNLASMSNWSHKPEHMNIVALAKDVLTTFPTDVVDANNNTGMYTLSSGTSMSTAIVTRTAALLRAYNNNLTAAQTKQLIIDFGKPVSLSTISNDPTKREIIQTKLLDQAAVLANVL
ncbi:MAG: S8 family peptidase [Saprospiraceae bacterium]